MNATLNLPEVEENGLTASQVRACEESGQTNAVKSTTSRSVLDIVRANVFTLFNGIIFAAMVLVLITGSWKDAVFGFVILINTGIGIVTELKAKRTLDRLSILVTSDYAVRRDGENTEVPSRDIVLGDLLWIRSGEQVPADAQVLSSYGLELDESMLTGESRTVRKEDGDQVYSGSTAVSGVALARVNAVGEHSYAATLTAQAKVYKKTVSDLNKGINTILKFMTFLVVPLCVLLVWSQMRTVGGWNAAIASGEWRQAIVSAVAGVVGMIPEGLVLLTSLNFAVAAMRLARKNTLVQELESVETLARVDCLNLDKTGTITDGGIMFDRLVMLERMDGDDRVESAATQALYDLSNEEQPNGTGQAVLDGLGERGYHAGPVRARVPFSSARKWSAIVTPAAAAETESAADREPPTVWYMGAPEVMLSALSGEHGDVLEAVNDYANSGNRVLLIARATLIRKSDGDAATDSSWFTQSPELLPDAKPVALVLCSERVRDDAQPTLAWFRDQGVRCRIISGDNPVTVGAIAAKVRLTGDREPHAIDARTLPQDINELARVLENVDVIGRVLPDQKKAIVQALHTQNHVVAMTGDGVNDLLAMKQADCSIAFSSGAQAASQLGSLVLLNNDFAAMPGIVAEGRRVINNIQRAATLFLVKNIFSLFLSVISLFTDWPYPLQPMHLTVISALTIGIPSFFLAMEPNYDRVTGHFLRGVLRRAFPGGLTNVFAVLVCQAFMVVFDLPAASIATVCAGILAVVGMMVLFQVCKPFGAFRRIVWGAMLVCLIVVFTCLGELFELRSGTVQTNLLMLTLLLMTPTVFFAMQRLFDWGEKFIRRVFRRETA